MAKKKKGVLLLRGINVGGKNVVPMQRLRDTMESLGAENVTTYIQSGNAVFRLQTQLGPFAAKVATTLASEFGFQPQTMAMSEADFVNVLNENPFADKAAEGKYLHTWILQEAAHKADIARLRDLAANGEQFELSAKAFYLFAPNGIGRSRLASSVEASLGVVCTARNANTLQKLQQLLADLD